MTEATAPNTRELINGLRVITREQATHETPLNPGVQVSITGVDQVLLEDETVVYQCVAAEDCFDAFDRALSARAHLVKHSTKRADRVEAQRIIREAAAERERRSVAAKKAAATRRRRKEEPVPEVESPAAASLDTAMEAINTALNLLDTFSGHLEDASAHLVAAANQLQRDINAFKKQASANVDPELVEKAKKWDDLRNSLK